MTMMRRVTFMAAKKLNNPLDGCQILAINSSKEQTAFLYSGSTDLHSQHYT